MKTHRIYKYVIRNDGHSPVQNSAPSRSFTSNFGSLSAQLTIKIFFQRNKFSSTTSKVTQKTYSPRNKGSYENKGRKTEKESKAALVMLRLTHFV